MKKCFVISQIGNENSEIRKHADKVLKYIIRPSLENELGYKVQRADESTQPGSISKSIIKDILTSDLVIADLTGHNPNVFYELALRHATRKPFIQIIESAEKLPFDLYDIRTISYDLDLDGAENAIKTIIDFASNLEKEENITTPISEVSQLLQIDIGNNQSTSNDVLINELQRINENISNLEYKLAGRIEQMSANSQNLNMTVEEQMGLKFMEKLMDNPHKSDDMMNMITKFNKFKK